MSLTLMQAPGLLQAQDIYFAADGRAVLSNALFSVTADNRAGGWNSGLRSWYFQPTGCEMIDVLYGQTDYLTGHLFGEVWDAATLGLEVPGGRPSHGVLYVPEGVGRSSDGRVAVLRQMTRDQYALQREIVLRRDSAMLEVRYRLTNLTAAPAGMSLRLHSTFSPGARGRYQDKNDSLFLRLTNGVVALDQTLRHEAYRAAYGGADKFFNQHRATEPSRGWVNPRTLPTPLLMDNWGVWASRQHGDGLLVVVEAEKLLGFYNCPGSSFEPVMLATSLKPGESYEVQLYVASFTGLKETTPLAVNPLFITTQALELRDGSLSGGHGRDSGYGDFRRQLPQRFADREPREGGGGNSYEAEEMFTLLRRHLEQRGWLERFVIKVGDEPLGFDWWLRSTVAVRNAGLPLTTAFNSIDWSEADKGLGIVRQWTPLYMLYNADFFAKARAAGDAISWYNCGPPPRITLSATASELRSYLWQAAKADLDFVVWWGIQNWGYYSHEALWHNRHAHGNTLLYPEHPDKPRWNKKGYGWLDTAPLFVDAAAGDYRLAAGSPGINAGQLLPWIDDATLDLLGLPRLRTHRPDMGAYEFQPPAGTILLLR